MACITNVLVVPCAFQRFHMTFAIILKAFETLGCFMDFENAIESPWRHRQRTFPHNGTTRKKLQSVGSRLTEHVSLNVKPLTTYTSIGLSIHYTGVGQRYRKSDLLGLINQVFRDDSTYIASSVSTDSKWPMKKIWEIFNHIYPFLLTGSFNEYSGTGTTFLEMGNCGERPKKRKKREE